MASSGSSSATKDRVIVSSLQNCWIITDQTPFTTRTKLLNVLQNGTEHYEKATQDLCDASVDPDAKALAARAFPILQYYHFCLSAALKSAEIHIKQHSAAPEGRNAFSAKIQPKELEAYTKLKEQLTTYQIALISLGEIIFGIDPGEPEQKNVVEEDHAIKKYADAVKTFNKGLDDRQRDELVSEFREELHELTKVFTGLKTGDSLNFDNLSILELVIHASYLSKRKSGAPKTLSELKIMMQDLKVSDSSRKGGRSDNFKTGLPDIVFACMSHKEPVITCSGDRWEGFQGIQDEVRIWREFRFEKYPLKRNDLEKSGQIAKTAFDELSAQILDEGLKARASKRELADAESNKLVEDMDTIIKKTNPGISYAFDHHAESGRPFFGNANRMMDETSRCWKCYFIHIYNGSCEHLLPEVPNLTAFNANPPLNCAEDLASMACDEFLGHVTQPTIPPTILPFPHLKH